MKIHAALLLSWNSIHFVQQADISSTACVSMHTAIEQCCMVLLIVVTASAVMVKAFYSPMQSTIMSNICNTQMFNINYC